MISNRAVLGNSDSLKSVAILLQVGTKNRKYGAEELGGGLEGSQSGGRAVGYAEMRHDFKLP